ncbi:MAG: BrnA antitoxin family protein [Anaerolineae bacterium]
MNKNSTSEALQTDWACIDSLRDEDIDLSDIPQVTEEQMARATLRVGGQPVPRGKVRVTMFLDAAVVAYFKARSGGRGYQTLINETLKENIRERDLETILRRVIREELATIKPV